MIPPALHRTPPAADEFEVAVSTSQVIAPMETSEPVDPFCVNPHSMGRAPADNHLVGEWVHLSDDLETGRDCTKWRYRSVAPLAGAAVVSRRWSRDERVVNLDLEVVI